MTLDELKEAGRLIARMPSGTYGSIEVLPDGLKVTVCHDSTERCIETILLWEELETRGVLASSIKDCEQRVIPEWLK